MGELNEFDRQKLVCDLTALYNENFIYLTKMKDGKTETAYSQECIKRFEKLLAQCKSYISEVEVGLEVTKDFGDWCDLFVDALLDDDNFYMGGEW